MDWRARQTSLDSLAGYTGAPPSSAGDTAFPERLRGVRMTPNTMRVLRVAPIVGRDLTDADAAPGAPAVALISYRQWQSRFDGRPDAIGAVDPAEQPAGDGRRRHAGEVRISRKPQDIWMPLSMKLPAKRGEGQRREHHRPAARRRDDRSSAGRSSRRSRDSSPPSIPRTRTRSRASIRSSTEAIPQRIRTTFFTMMARGARRDADRLRERHEPAAGARRGTDEGVRDSHGARLGPVAHPAPVARRRPGAVAALGAAIGLALAHVGTGVLHARDRRHAAAVLDRRPPRRHRAALRHRDHRRDDARLEPRAGPARRRARTRTRCSRTTRAAPRACVWAASAAGSSSSRSPCRACCSWCPA